IGYLHREFTVFALPAVILVEWRDWWERVRSDRRYLASLVGGFASVWIVVGILKASAAPGGIGLQVASLRGQMCFDWMSVRGNVQALVAEALPALFGLQPLPLSALRMTTPVVAGSFTAGYTVLAALAVLLIRFLRHRAVPAFAGYLILV